MSTGYQSRSYGNHGVPVPASQTNAPICSFAINNENRLNIKADVYLGQVASTPVLKLQDSNGWGIWNDVKSTTLSASTDITVTPTAATGLLTAAAHGLTNGQLVTINSTGKVPGGLIPGTRYFVFSATTSTFQLGLRPSDAAPINAFSDVGSGTITVTAATVATFALNVNVSGDQAVMPLRPNGRLVATTSGGQTVQVLDFRLGYTY